MRSCDREFYLWIDIFSLVEEILYLEVNPYLFVSMHYFVLEIIQSLEKYARTNSYKKCLSKFISISSVTSVSSKSTKRRLAKKHRIKKKLELLLWVILGKILHDIEERWEALPWKYLRLVCKENSENVYLNRQHKILHAEWRIKKRTYNYIYNFVFICMYSMCSKICRQ